MSEIGIPELVNLVSSIGNWILFFYLFVQKDRELREAREAHRDDLREIAGMAHYLSRRGGATDSSPSLPIIPPHDSKNKAPSGF